MRRYRFHLEWVEEEEYASSDKAKESLRDTYAEIEALAEGRATLEVLDVQAMPRDRGDTREIRFDNPHPQDNRALAVSGDMPSHPWDQNLFIFPDDHPLAQYERLAWARERTEGPKEIERQVFLEAGQKMLTP